MIRAQRVGEAAIGEPGERFGSRWILAAAVLALASTAVIAAVEAWLLFGPETGRQWLVPGRSVIELEGAGKYVIWNDFRTVFGGRTFASSEEVPADLRLALVDLATLQALPTQPAPGSKSSRGEHQRHSIAAFTIDRPANVEILVEGSFAPRVLFIDRDRTGTVVLTLALALLVFCLALGVAAWAWWRRERAFAQMPGIAAAPDSRGSALDARDAARLGRLTALVYALQIAASFCGLSFFVAIGINAICRKDVAGTWLDAHFRWQIRTFRFGLLWGCAGVALLVLLVGVPILMATMAWVLYRAITGWLALSEGRAPGREARPAG